MSEETISLLGDAGGPPEQTPVSMDDSDFASESVAEIDEEADPEPLSPDEVKTRRSLVRRIAHYKVVFPAELTELTSELEGLIHKSPAELAALLEEVQFLVETCRSTAQARGFFLAGLTMGEAAGPYVGLKLHGLTQVARQSNDLMVTVDECALKYEGVVQVDPVVRLAMAIGQLCLAVDGANRAREAVAEQTNIKRQDYSDL